MKRAIFVLAFGIALGSLSSIASAQQAAALYTFATRYNVAGQVTGTISPDPDDGGNLRFSAMRNTYGTSGATAGLLVTTEVGELSTWLDEGTKPEGWSGAFTVFQTRTFEYDDQGRKSAERVKGKNGAIESLVQYSYDSWDRVDCRAVRMNPATFSSSSTPACSLASPSDRITKFTYDDLDQVLTETRGLLTPLVQTYVTNTYEARGQLKTQKDANGNLTTLEYENGRLKKRLYPWADSQSQSSPYDYNAYTYDNNGNVKTERKRNGTTVTYSYDANNRLTFKDLSDNSNSQDISYGYDLRGLALYSCFGNIYTTACDASGEGETNKFDGFGNLEWRKSRMFGTTRQLFYQYDLEGNRTRITHPDGTYFSYKRDGLNRVCTLGESASAPACNSAEADDYLAIHYSSEGRRADIVRPGSVTGYTTDNALRLDVFTQSFAATANNLSNGFDYNAAGQITLLTQSNIQYNYTEAQNRVGSYGVNDLNQYTSIDGVTVTHDANGNLTADGTGMTFSYDMENRLVSTGTPASGLYYDVLGRLARVTVAGTTTDFHYDGDALVGEHVVGTGQTRRYVHSGGVDEPLVQYNIVSGVTTKHYLHADHQGSIIAHSDNAGAVAQKNSYDPYGVPKSTNDGRFGYTGQTWIPQLGLNYYKARFYSPKLGRFLQTDPIFYKDDMNLYAYVKNDPLNGVDPDGRTCVLYSGNNQQMATCIADNATANNNVSETKRDPPREAVGKSVIGNLESKTAEKTAIIVKDGNGGFKQLIQKPKAKEVANGLETKTLGGPGVVTQHSHPEQGGSIAPGYLSKTKNDSSVLQVGGISQIYQGGRIGTLTIGSEGVTTYEVDGQMSSQDIRDTQKSLNKIQTVLEDVF